MSKILFINACVRPRSRTLELARHFLKEISGEVEEVNLYDCSLAPLDLAGMECRDRAAATGDYSDRFFDLARQFAAAETIVVAAPYWDLMFPSVLKLYLEAVTVSGLTFRYSPQGIPESLCKASKLYYITTAGGPIGPYDFGFSYMEAVSRGFFGIGEVHRVSAEGLDIVGADVEQIMGAAKAELLQMSKM